MAKKHFIIWILLCSFSTAVAQNYVPIKIVSGFNADVIANGVGPVSSSTTHTFDINGFTLVSRDFVAQPGNAVLTVGLPKDGRITAVNDPNLMFQLNPYSQNNSMRLVGSGTSGNLVFQTPENATQIVLLTAAGNAIGSPAKFSGEIRFTDNTIQHFSGLYSEDWYSNGVLAPTITYGIGRASALDNLVHELKDFPRLFGAYIELSVSNYYKKISSIHVFKTSTTTEVLNIMAVSVKKTPDCFQPTNIKIDNISTNQATIRWDAAIVAPDLGYEYEIRTSGVAGSGVLGLVASGAVSNSTVFKDITNLSPSTEYSVYVRSKCTATSFSDWSLSKNFETSCLVPTVTATGSANCQPAALNLTAATTDGVIKWYDGPTTSTVLHTGQTYTTPFLNATKSYWVDAILSNFVTVESGKKAVKTNASHKKSYQNRGISFDLAYDVILKSTDIFVGTAGTLDVAIYDSSGAELFSTGDLSISASGIDSPVIIPLNVHLTAGKGYRLVIKSFTGIEIYSDDTAVSFPYSDSSKILTVTSAVINGSHTPYVYYYFYNLTFEKGCKSPRQEVLATVYNTLAPTTSAAIQTFCFDAGTQLKDLSINGSHIKWYTAATAVNPWSETALVTDGATYYASQTLNGCESLDRLAITTKLERINVFSVNQNIDYNYKDVAVALSATPAPGNKIFWYLTAAAVDGDETAPVPDTSTVGAQKYWVREISALGCISDAVEITVTVNPVELTVTADSDLRKVYGASDPVLTYTATGFVGLDDKGLLTGLLDRMSGEVAGSYAITEGTLNAGPNYTIRFISNLFTIEKAPLTAIVFDGKTMTYDGTAKSLVLTGLPTGATVSYTNNDQIDAGTHTVTATINGGANYEDTVLTAVLTIEKALVDGLTFNDQTFTYDGSSKSLAVDGTWPAAVTVSYSNNDKIVAGTYTVTANIHGGLNYHDNTLTALLTIEKADIPTMVFDNAIFVYDGFSKSILIENTLPIGVTVNYTNNGQKAAGTYTVTANINGGTNYQNTTISATMIIQKASIPGISFSNVTIPYDGTAKSIYISGTLLTAAVVTYQNNGQINLGTYPIVATIVGGNNYEDLVLNATLTIEKGVLSNVYLPSATYTYDGQQKSLQIGGSALPPGVTVSYLNNGHTDAGIYTVKAEINGGANYHDRVLQSVLTIKRAPIENITFSNATFTYDKTIKALAVSGSLGAGVTVSYKNNGHINAGVYTVIADIDGGKNYNYLQLTAQMIIEKASQLIDFKALDVLTLEDGVDFQLAANADSGLAISYTYTFTTATAAATVSESGWVMPKHPGILLITAHQGGDNNYLSAPSVTRELRIVSRDASIHELWIGSQHYIAPPEQIHYIMDCDDLKAKVKVIIQAQSGATIDPGQEFVIDIIKPGMHTQTIRITSENGAVTKEYQIIIEKPFPFHAIVQQKYNHVLLINNNPNTNGGFKFVKFEWYKNDQLIGEEQVYSSGNKEVDVLDTKALYRAVLTSSTGQVFTVCPSYIELKNSVVFRLHPNPVEVGARIVLTISDAEFITIGDPLRIYDMKGRLVQQGIIAGYNTEVQLSSSVPSGVYLAVFRAKGQDKVIKFIVK